MSRIDKLKLDYIGYPDWESLYDHYIIRKRDTEREKEREGENRETVCCFARTLTTWPCSVVSATAIICVDRFWVLYRQASLVPEVLIFFSIIIISISYTLMYRQVNEKHNDKEFSLSNFQAVFFSFTIYYSRVFFTFYA